MPVRDPRVIADEIAAGRDSPRLRGEATVALRAQADEIDLMRSVFHAIYVDVSAARWNLDRRLEYIEQAAREFSPEPLSFREARGVLKRREDISPEHSIRASRDADGSDAE